MAEQEVAISERAATCASALNTTHLYYTDTELFSNNAKVIDEHAVEVNGSQLSAVVLDQTVMHPQGGKLMCTSKDDHIDLLSPVCVCVCVCVYIYAGLYVWRGRGSMQVRPDHGLLRGRCSTVLASSPRPGDEVNAVVNFYDDS